ncbi:MAG TPA: acyl-CoA dehydrogenase domain-containing protein, partial [Alphaproteobacteria bacterium]|nr:acyl-CoA dehydrogenase domain-containing protein [Alphaproteobacteria bacterium]
ASAALKRFHDDGQPAGDLPLLRWSCDLALWNIQGALAGVLDNLPNRPAAIVLRALIFPLGRRLRPPADTLGAELAQGLLYDDEMRRRLTRDIFVPDGGEEGFGRLEAALALAVEARPVKRKIRQAIRRGAIAAEPAGTVTKRACAMGVISAEERQRADSAAQACGAVIQVDAFAAETYALLKG